MANTINADNGVISGITGIRTTADNTGNLALQTNGNTVLTLNTANAAVFAGSVTANSVVSTSTINAPNTFGFKNRIINGNMTIDQRNAGASITPTTSGTYTVDRWSAVLSVSSKFSVSQNAGSVTPPAGFINYLGATSLSAYTVGAAETFALSQAIEGLNVADLAWGTADAKTVTLSFWVRSSLTGTFGGSLRNSATDRSYPFSYTISSANTWEQKSITITGDTTGTWLTTNGVGIYVNISLGAGATRSGTAGAWAAANYTNATGATSVVGTNGATFYITGVQIEVGSQATSFDFRDYGRELIMCQRYYQKFSGSSGRLGWLVANGPYNGTASIFNTIFQLPITMRSVPTIDYANLAVYNNGVGSLPNFNTIYAYAYSPFSINIDWSGGSGGYGGVVFGELHVSTTGYFAAISEL